MKRPAAGVTGLAAVLLAAAAGCGNDTPAPDQPLRPQPTVEPAPQAEAQLDTIHQYPSAVLQLAAPQPATVQLAGTEQLTARIDTEAAREPDADIEAVVILDFGELTTSPGYALIVFVNTPDADLDTPTSAPGFIGTVAFPHRDPPAAGQPVRALLPATDAIRASTDSDAVRVTLVPDPDTDHPASRATLEVRVTVTLVRAPA